MGGHSAWRKRVAAGGLAKGSGGASLRHRPHLGRRGADLALNRKGNLGGHVNPKKKATKRTRRDFYVNRTTPDELYLSMKKFLEKATVFRLMVATLLTFILIFAVSRFPSFGSYGASVI